MSLVPFQHRAASFSPPPGSLFPVAHNGAPDPGYLLCDGSVYNISDYPVLGAKLGSLWGGDGVTTFAVPNFTAAGRALVGAGTAGTQTSGSGSFAHTHDNHTSTNVGLLGLLTAALTGPTTHSQYEIPRVHVRMWVKT